MNETLEYIKNEKNNATIPVLLDYRANRFFNNCYDHLEKEKSYKVPQFAAYENAFFKNLTHFYDFVNWFRIEEDKENELIKRECNFYLTNPKLQVIRKATTIFFAKHLITNNQYTNNQ